MLILIFICSCDDGHDSVNGVVISSVDNKPIEDVYVSAYNDVVKTGPLGEFWIESESGSGDFDLFAIFEKEDKTIEFEKESYKKKKLHIKSDMEVYLDPVNLK